MADLVNPMATSSEIQLTEKSLEANEKLALLAQQREFEFQHARETEAKKWLPNLMGEMDEETDSEAESSE